LAAVVDTLSDRSARFAAIGTPAEETGAGKAIMARSGAFEGLDVVLVPSIGPENWAGIATFAGVDAIVRLRGRESHVTYRPEAGRNALDAMLLAFHNISAMRPYLPGEGKIHGVIKEGGSKANTIPGFASAEFIVRASNEGALDRGIAILERCVQAGALASGCEAEVSVGEKYLPMINVPSLNAVILKELKSLGVNAVDVSSRPPFGCADTGNVSQVAPTGYFHVSLGKGLIPHTEEYAQASGSRPGHDALVLLARATAAIVDELLADSSLLQRVTEEYAQIRADR
jgi:metal-dependent amidase/aminoacylase/carboxypeptidase family protein